MATAEFPKFAGILSAALSQHHLSGFEIAQLYGRALSRLVVCWVQGGEHFVCGDGGARVGTLA